MSRLINLLLLFCFILYNSNLFFYQHYCGNELYGTALFHTITCGCEDEFGSLSTENGIFTKEDGCCQEIIIYAHNPLSFYNFHFILTLFFVFLSIFLVFKKLFADSLFRCIHFLFYRYFKQTHQSFFHLLLHFTAIRSVILRN